MLVCKLKPVKSPILIIIFNYSDVYKSYDLESVNLHNVYGRLHRGQKWEKYHDLLWIKIKLYYKRKYHKEQITIFLWGDRVPELLQEDIIEDFWNT